MQTGSKRSYSLSHRCTRTAPTSPLGNALEDRSSSGPAKILDGVLPNITCTCPLTRSISAGPPPQPRLGGSHILTGPVAVRGAKAGEVLEVRIKSIGLNYNWGYNQIRPQTGA